MLAIRDQVGKYFKYEIFPTNESTDAFPVMVYDAIADTIYVNLRFAAESFWLCPEGVY